MERRCTPAPGEGSRATTTAARGTCSAAPAPGCTSPALAEARVALWLAGHVDELANSATAARDRTDEHAKAERLVTEHRTEVQRLETALVNLATNLAEGLVDPAVYSTARTGLLDRRDAATRDLADAEQELARVAPLPDDVHDRLVAVTEDMDTSEWSALVRQVVRSVEVHPETIVIRPVVGDAVVVAR